MVGSSSYHIELEAVPGSPVVEPHLVGVGWTRDVGTGVVSVVGTDGYGALVHPKRFDEKHLLLFRLRVVTCVVPVVDVVGHRRTSRKGTLPHVVA